MENERRTTKKNKFSTQIHRPSAYISRTKYEARRKNEKEIKKKIKNKKQQKYSHKIAMRTQRTRKKNLLNLYMDYIVDASGETIHNDIPNYCILTKFAIQTNERTQHNIFFLLLSSFFISVSR